MSTRIVVCAIDRKRHPLWTRGLRAARTPIVQRSRPHRPYMAWSIADAMRAAGFRVWLEAPGAPACS